MVQQLLLLCSVCNSGSIRYICISLKRNDLILIMPFASFDDDIVFFDFIDQAIGCIHSAAIFAVFTFELFRLSDTAHGTVSLNTFEQLVDSLQHPFVRILPFKILLKAPFCERDSAHDSAIASSSAMVFMTTLPAFSSWSLSSNMVRYSALRRALSMRLYSVSERMTILRFSFRGT